MANIPILYRLPRVLVTRGNIHKTKVCDDAGPNSRVKHFVSGKTKLYEEIKKGLYTPPIKISSGRASAWPEHEVAALNAAAIAGFTDEQLKKLVADLMAKRASMAAQAVPA